jgi:hypothetical protein
VKNSRRHGEWEGGAAIHKGKETQERGQEVDSRLKMPGAGWLIVVEWVTIPVLMRMLNGSGDRCWSCFDRRRVDGSLSSFDEGFHLTAHQDG